MSLKKNKFTQKNSDGTTIEISLGSIYFVLRDYKALNYNDFEGSDILIAMPTSIENNGIIRFYTICINNSNGFFVHSHSKDSLAIATPEEEVLNVDTDALVNLFRQMPERGYSNINLLDHEIEAYVLNMQCFRKDLIDAPIVNTGHKIRDLRRWPREAIDQWASQHLQLSIEQLSALREFKQKWKQVAYAQEVFTHQCSLFNAKAKEVIDKKKEEMLQVKKMNTKPRHDYLEDCIDEYNPEQPIPQPRARVVHPANIPKRIYSQISNYRERGLDHNTEIVVIGDIGYFNLYDDGENASSIGRKFHNHRDHRTSSLVLSREVRQTQRGADVHITASIDGHDCEILAHNDIRPGPDVACIVYIDNYFLHLRKKGRRSSAKFERCVMAYGTELAPDPGNNSCDEIIVPPDPRKAKKKVAKYKELDDERLEILNKIEF